MFDLSKYRGKDSLSAEEIKELYDMSSKLYHGRERIKRLLDQRDSPYAFDLSKYESKGLLSDTDVVELNELKDIASAEMEEIGLLLDEEKEKSEKRTRERFDFLWKKRREVGKAGMTVEECKEYDLLYDHYR